MKKHFSERLLRWFRKRFRSLYYKPNQLIMSVENVCCRGEANEGGSERSGWKRSFFLSLLFLPPFGESSFYCFEAVPRLLSLMLSFGKLMKMWGSFSSCESLTNHNLIAPSFVVLDCFFYSLLAVAETRRQKQKKSHFQIIRAKFFFHLWAFSFSYLALWFQKWLHNRKWRINIWGVQTEKRIVQSILFRFATIRQYTSSSNKLLSKSNYVNEMTFQPLTSSFSVVCFLFLSLSLSLSCMAKGAIKHFKRN